MKIPATGWLTGRAIEEWVGATPDAAIPDRVIVRLFMRQEGKCAITGARLIVGHYHADHRKPLKKGGEHRESNLQLVAEKPHREKTAEEAGEQAQVNRKSKNHFGITRQKKKWPKRGFGEWKDNSKQLRDL